MPKQLPLPVTEIALPQAVFHDTVYRPAAVNLICGRNGTGKSTIAGCFRRHSVLQDTDPARMPQISIFDSSYVQQNIRQNVQLAGIVTLSRTDAAVNAQLADLRRRKLLAEAELRDALTEMQPLQAKTEEIYANFAETVWRRSAALRARYPMAVRGGKNSAKFAKNIRFTSPHYYDTARLDRMYKLAFGGEARIYPMLHSFEDFDTLDRLAEDPLLDEVLCSSGNSQFQRFLSELGAADWVQQGYHDYSDSADGRCPYCQQPLPADFAEQFSACFDRTYQEGMKRLRALEKAYRQAAEAAAQALYEEDAERCPYADYYRYDTDSELLLSLLRENIDAIREKRRTPAQPAVLTGVRELMLRLDDTIETVNRRIAYCNLFVTDRAAMQEKCVSCVMSYLAYRLSEETAQLQAELRMHTALLSDLEDKRDKMQEKIAVCNAETARLSAILTDTEQAAAEINRLLRDADFTGFSLRQSKRHPRAYEIVRPDGQAAAVLSEGERRFLAFLYFYVSMQQPAENGRVLVLDDPYTALDSEAAAVVQRLTRELCGQCGRARKGIRQVFVMTCRPQLYRELQLDLPDDAAAVTLHRQGGKTALYYDIAH